MNTEQTKLLIKISKRDDINLKLIQGLAKEFRDLRELVDRNLIVKNKSITQVNPPFNTSKINFITNSALTLDTVTFENKLTSLCKEYGITQLTYEK